MKKITFLLVSALAFLQVNAQKLPNVQQVSLRAPANVKIDGKATEWGDSFKAFNLATDLYYTIANDDKRLYIIFFRDSKKNENMPQAGNGRMRPGGLINSVINGGIRINIQKNATKSDKDALAIKFPYFKTGTQVSFMLRDIGKVDQFADSIMKVNNKRLTATVKWIYTQGIAGVDNELSVYNDKGIEAANAFDIKKNYICEVAIDLQLLGLSVSNASKFTYHILVNADPNKYSVVKNLIGDPNLRGTNFDGTPTTLAQYQDFLKTVNMPATDGTTDFWGEYTLAK